MPLQSVIAHCRTSSPKHRKSHNVPELENSNSKANVTTNAVFEKPSEPTIAKEGERNDAFYSEYQLAMKFLHSSNIIEDDGNGHSQEKGLSKQNNTKESEQSDEVFSHGNHYSHESNSKLAINFSEPNSKAVFSSSVISNSRYISDVCITSYDIVSTPKRIVFNVHVQCYAVNQEWLTRKSFIDFIIIAKKLRLHPHGQHLYIPPKPWFLENLNEKEIGDKQSQLQKLLNQIMCTAPLTQHPSFVQFLQPLQLQKSESVHPLESLEDIDSKESANSSAASSLVSAGELRGDREGTSTEEIIKKLEEMLQIKDAEVSRLLQQRNVLIQLLKRHCSVAEKYGFPENNLICQSRSILEIFEVNNSSPKFSNSSSIFSPED